MKWYLAYSGVNLDIGGNTPKASQVKKIIFLACPASEGNLALGICSKGYETLVFSVISVLW